MLMRSLILSTLALASAVVTTRADTLRLSNGDTVNGQFLRIEDESVLFQTEHFGVVTVPVDACRVELKVSRKNNRDSVEESQPASPMAAMDNGRGGTLSAAASASTRKRNKKSPWKRTMELGYTDQSGRKDKTDVATRMEFERKGETNELRLQARYLYGKTNSEVSTDTISSGFRFRQAFSETLFAQAETKYERDEVKGIDHDAQQSVGLGRTLIKDEVLSLKVGGGAAARFRDSDDLSGIVGFFDAFQEMSYTFSDRLSISQDFSVLTTPFIENALTLKVNAALKGALSETLGMTVRYEYEYDHSLDADARTNQRVITSLAYNF